MSPKEIIAEALIVAYDSGYWEAERGANPPRLEEFLEDAEGVLKDLDEAFLRAAEGEARE